MKREFLFVFRSLGFGLSYQRLFQGCCFTRWIQNMNMSWIIILYADMVPCLILFFFGMLDTGPSSLVSSSRFISTPISDIICSVSKYLYFVHSSIWFFYCSIAPSVPVAVHPTQIMYVLVLLSHCCCLCIPHQYSNVAEYNGLMVFIGSCETDIIH